MNLKPLFKMQQELDDFIIDEKGLEGQDLLPEKILALQVELGELANEWRGFKFWSEDREPRVKAYHKSPSFDPDKLGWFTKNYNPLLEEYVDCLHFILSIGNDLRFNSETPYLVNEKSTIDLFLDLYRSVSKFHIVSGREHKHFYYNEILSNFFALGKSLVFTWEEIEEGYHAKHKINMQRQESGY